MTQSIAIHWFRQDLRLADNPALYEASRHPTMLPVYILDDVNPGRYRMGAASRWWLFHSLSALNRSLDGALNLYQDDPLNVLTDIADRYPVDAVYWNRCYEPWQTARDSRIKEVLKARGISVKSFNGSLLREPWENVKQDNSPYRVFTQFYRRCYPQSGGLREPLPEPENLRTSVDQRGRAGVESLGLIPRVRWDRKLEPHWRIGEESALERMRRFVKKGLAGYRKGRDFPAGHHVSRLSPHLHFGEISPSQVWHSVRSHAEDEDREHFRSELAWREFSYHLLYHFPILPDRNLQPKFDRFPWRDNSRNLEAWCRGRTGVPLVDAGMRELWETGYMHNRLRMVVGSFLVKNLMLHWRHGAAWFNDCLVDADLANNCAGWQWIAGCGADAAPYFRIFNPVAQGQKFDPTGEYTRRYVPELARVPDKYLFSPWQAPADVLDRANVVLGETYPQPIVDLPTSRKGALNAFASLNTPDSRRSTRRVPTATISRV